MENLIQSYEITKQIGSGGMATVFMGRHPSLDRQVAIKVVKGDNRDKVKRFAREAVLSAALKQENLPAIYDYFVDAQKNHYLVMEYVDGIDVSDIIKTRGFVPHYAAVMIAREVARGLEHMHEKGIIHRDIKPSNVRLSKDGQVKLMDFGIAKQEDEEAHKNLTSTGIIIGTPSYMSPEQASGDKLTTQSDIFSLGTMMYEMLTGKKPFSADSNLTLITLIAQGRYEPLDRSQVSIPKPLIRIVDRAMSKNLDSRYQHIGLVIKDLNQYLQSISQSQLLHFLMQYYLTLTSKNKNPDFSPFAKLPHVADTPEHNEPPDELSTGEYIAKFYDKGKRKKKIAIAAAVTLIITVVTWLTWKGLWPFDFNGPAFGNVNLSLKSDKTDVLNDVRIYVNDNEWPRSGNFDGKATLNHFQKGRNALRIKFPILYQNYEYNFTLEKENESKDVTLDLDKLSALLDAYRGESRRLGFAVNTDPAGAFVYIDNDFKNIFAKTPSPLTWPNIRATFHKISIQKDGFRTVEIERPFSPNELLNIHVDLVPDKKK
ncbi:serine/threonine protein kinase [bacterium]|nr:serine/threonine protein kinase [bacterium]